MILYYALGGGLGHLVRARAVLYTLGLTERTLIVTGSPFGRDGRVLGGLEVLPAPLELAGDLPAYRTWLLAVLEHYHPSAVYLDAFPAGVLGEWCDLPLPPDLPIYHLARLLRWPEYRPQITGRAPRLTRAYVLEDLTPEHATFLSQQAAELATLDLIDPPARLDSAILAEVRQLAGADRPLWLVVHAGMVGEIADLLAFATEHAQATQPRPRLLLIAPQRPPALAADILYSDLYPAAALFPLADRIVTACGFNSMRQARPYGARHLFRPFARRFDDQFARAARRQAELDPATPPATPTP